MKRGAARAVFALVVVLLGLVPTRVAARAAALARTALEGARLARGRRSTAATATAPESASTRARASSATAISARASPRGRACTAGSTRGRPCEACHVEHLGAPLMRWPGGSAQQARSRADRLAAERRAQDHAVQQVPQQGQRAGQRRRTSGCRRRARRATRIRTTAASARCAPTATTRRRGRTSSRKACRASTTTWRASSCAARTRRVACAKCHFDPPKYTGLKFALCGDCHKDPHAGRLGTACTDCHEDTQVEAGDVQARGGEASGHRASPTATRPSRAGRATTRATSPRPRGGPRASSCHRSVHKAPFGRACGELPRHRSSGWACRARSASPRTRRPQYPLTGKHEERRLRELPQAEHPARRAVPEARLRALRRLPRGQAQRRVRQHGRRRVQAVPHDGGVPPHALRRRAARVDALPARRQARRRRRAPSCHTTPRPLLDLHVAKQACADCHANPHGDQFAEGDGQGRLRAVPRGHGLEPAEDRPQHLAADRRARRPRRARAATTRRPRTARRAAARATAASRATARGATTTSTSASSGSRSRCSSATSATRPRPSRSRRSITRR